MAGIFDGLNFDPLAMLQARALDPSTTGSVAASGVASPPPAATPPAPVASPAATGGGGSFLGGIGTALANAMSGAGVMGDIPSDTEIDPVSGIPRGIARRANNQSMMKMGMTLLMAGLSRDPGTRGKMLAALPGTMDSTDTINAFAKTRLEMARTKLIERQVLSEEATNAAVQRTYGPAGGPVGTVATGTPAAIPAGGAPVSAGPVAAVPPPATPGAVSGATVAAPAPIPVAGAAPALGAAVQGGAAGVAPIPLTPEAVSGLPTKPPPPPPVPKWVPTPEERAAVGLLRGSAATDFISKRTAEAANKPIESAPYKVPEMNAIMVDTYQGGQKVGSKKVGDLPSSVVESPDKRGGFTRKTVTPSGAVTNITDVAGPTKFVDTPHPTKPGVIIREKIAADGSVESKNEIVDPAVEEDRKLVTQIAHTDRDALKTRYEKDVRPAITTYERAIKFRDELAQGKGIVGTASDMRRAVLRTAASVGWLKPDKINELVLTGRLEAELGKGAGQFAKQYYGPQISNADVTAANRLIGALMTNSREEIMAALDLVLNENKVIARAYKEDATRHNASIPDNLPKTRERLSVPVPEKDLDAPIEKTINGVTYVNDGQGWRVKP